MVLLGIRADADLPDLPLVQLIDLDRRLPEGVPFPKCLIINAQNISEYLVHALDRFQIQPKHARYQLGCQVCLD